MMMMTIDHENQPLSATSPPRGQDPLREYLNDNHSHLRWNLT